ncbi:type IV pilus assembly protein PilM [Candidatus Saccharibacteria bacterium]|nr:type IV pilus assembly protein PilM [Candidatus Saccharibacteria bacterium]
MGNTNKIKKTPYFFTDKHVFGLDIGPGSLKVMQVNTPLKGANLASIRPQVKGYGFTTFDKAAIEDGVVIDLEVVAKAANDLFERHLIGDITTHRVALTIPAYRTFTRSLELPKLKASELSEAVTLEAEQYISVPIEELYLDYEITKETSDKIELFVVAVPKKIVDSYVDLAELLGLEPVLIEPTLSSSGRVFSLDKQSDIPAVVVDFGSRSADISIFDRHVLVTGTVQAGGEMFTTAIQEKLHVTPAEAGLIKTKYGLSPSKKQAEIISVMAPILDLLIKEVRRMIRYYEERYGVDRPITQIVTLGGGANMPGLSEYLTDKIRLAVRHTDPWEYLDYKGLQPPSAADKSMYASVTGLSLASPKDVF